MGWTGYDNLNLNLVFVCLYLFAFEYCAMDRVFTLCANLGSAFEDVSSGWMRCGLS